MIPRGILYIGGKWYGMEPLNTSSTFEHVLYELEDEQGILFHCGVLNGSLEHEMLVKQSVKYTFSSNTTSSRDRLLRVNIFLFLPWAAVQGISRAFAGGIGLAGHFLVPSFPWTPSWGNPGAEDQHSGDLTQQSLARTAVGRTWNAQAAIQLMHPSVWPAVNYWHRDVCGVVWHKLRPRYKMQHCKLIMLIYCVFSFAGEASCPAPEKLCRVICGCGSQQGNFIIQH